MVSHGFVSMVYYLNSVIPAEIFLGDERPVNMFVVDRFDVIVNDLEEKRNHHRAAFLTLLHE